MGELAECVQDVEAGVGHGDECQGQRHSTPQGRLTVVQLQGERERERERGRERANAEDDCERDDRGREGRM